MKAKNILYFQSGGPTAVINSSLYGVFIEAKKHPEIKHILGAKFGIEGVLNEDFCILDEEEKEEIELLKQTPDMVLGSSRKNLPPSLSDPTYSKLEEILNRYDIGYLLINGGNDSMLTAYRISSYLKNKGSDIRVIGIPKTIDNDLIGADHTLGYPSAALHTSRHIEMVAQDGLIYSKGKIQIVETMGRDTGWLAASSDILPPLLHPDFILLPEMKISLPSFYKQLKDVYEEKKRALIVLSEGVNPNVGEERDPFGHENFEGAAYHLANNIKKELGLSSRVTVLSSPARSDPYSLSHIDVKEAVACGQKAVELAINGYSGVIPQIERISNNPYQSSFRIEDLANVGGKVRYLPQEFLFDNTKMTLAFRDYLLPLLVREDIKLDAKGCSLYSKLKLAPYKLP